jgi:polyisoprenoid-binding protein YceI
MYLLLFLGLLSGKPTHPVQVPDKSVRADKSRSTISYHMVHPLHEWTGTNRSVDGVLQLDGSNGKVRKVAMLVKVSGFDSKNSNRDSHMMEVTEAIKFPAVSFVSNAVDDKGDQLEVKGILQFHGVSREVGFMANKTQEKNLLRVRGGFDILLDDFKLERPSLMMVEVDNKVNIAFDVYFPQ